MALINGKNKYFIKLCFILQHCEKSIQILQLRLLEYQQKITVALEVDKTKDNSLKKYHNLNDRFVLKQKFVIHMYIH